MRKIDFIVLHCTAGPQTQTVQSILNYWKNDLGWKTPGYHYLIKPDGEAVNLVPIEKPSNGVAGHNSNSIHISFIGGVQTSHNDPVNAYGRPIDNRTPEQKNTMKALVEKFSAMFPSAVIQGHRDFSPDKNRDGLITPDEWIKTCPSFSAKAWLKEIDFNSKLPGETFLRTTAGVNIREGGGTQFKPLGVLPKGTLVKKLGSANDWHYVKEECSKVVGWVSSKYLT